MMLILTFIGVIIVFIIFMYYLRIEAWFKQCMTSNSRLRIKPDELGFTKRVLERKCPICKTGLLRDEYLICAMEAEAQGVKKRQAHIYGCKHCLEDD